MKKFTFTIEIDTDEISKIYREHYTDDPDFVDLALPNWTDEDAERVITGYLSNDLIKAIIMEDYIGNLDGALDVYVDTENRKRLAR